MSTVLFVFAGRKPNLDLQLPLVRRILAENRDTQFHVWNLTKTPEDDTFVRSIRGERIRVLNDFCGPNPWARFNDVYKHYTADRYRNTRFVKIDDDVVFLETRRFKAFVDAIAPGRFLSAKVINNGACTPTEPELWSLFQTMGIDLLDVHLFPEYAELCHRWFFDNWRQVINHDPALTETQDWLSINVIGYTWETGCELARRVGNPSPRHIAGREFLPSRRGPARLGDEGAVNLFPRVIHEGFTAGHLYFGPQAKQMDESLLSELRKQYADIGRQYLA